MNQRELEVTALCDGAATLTKGGNRIASLALLWAAVGIAPTHLRAHRNLAAALANNGDLNAAAEEYARFVEFMLKAGEYQRAALELVYANSSLGSQPALVKVGRELIPLGAIVESLALPARVAPQVQQALPQLAASVSYAPARVSIEDSAPILAPAAPIAAAAIDRTPLLGVSMRAARLAMAGLMTVLASVTLSNVFAVVASATR